MRDLLTAISTVAAILIAAISVIAAISPPEGGTAKRAWVIVVSVLAAITVIAIAGAQYLDAHGKKFAQELLAGRRLIIGALITEGETLAGQCANKDVPLPDAAAQDWATRTEQFLTTLGPWYVNRFRSDAGIMPGISIAGAPERNNLWSGISARVIRLNEFAAELRE